MEGAGGTLHEEEAPWGGLGVAGGGMRMSGGSCFRRRSRNGSSATFQPQPGTIASLQLSLMRT